MSSAKIEKLEFLHSVPVASGDYFRIYHGALNWQARAGHECRRFFNRTGFWFLDRFCP